MPGKPDIVLPGCRAVVFVHGCFWHGHKCKRGRLPKSRREFWKRKIERNKARDTAAVAALTQDGWFCEVVWTCKLNDAHLGALARRLLRRRLRR